MNTPSIRILRPFRLAQLPLLALLALASAMLPQQASAEANYVYHERTTANPGGGGQYVTRLNPTSAENYPLLYKVEFQFFTDTARVYYTTDGSTPAGSFGTPSGTTAVLTSAYVYTFGGPVVDVVSNTIPAQPAGTVVKYIVSAWHSGGLDEIFGNGCGNCGSENSSSALATVHQYTVGSTTNLYWDSNGTTAGAGTTPTGTWGTSTFWSTVFDGTAATSAWTSGRNAVFAAGTDATTYTVTVSGTQTAGGVSFEEGTVLITGGTLALTGTGTYNVASGLVGTVGSTVTGTIGYAKTGTGRVALTSTASTITGAVSVTGGILEIISSGAIGGTGVGAGNITLNGGTFRNAATGAGITFLTGNRGFIIGASGGTIDVPGTSANIQIYTSGSITGVGNTLTKSGPGVLRNTTPTSITFTKLNVTGGLYQAAADTVFGAVPGAYLADAITLNGGGISVNAGVTFSANRGITLGASGGSIDGTSAPVVPSKITGVGALTKTGSGILTLSGANDFSGGVNQTTSRINYNNSSAAGTGTINVAAAATEFVCSSGTSTLTNSIVLASGANPRYYATSGNGIDQTGIISGTGALTRDDTGAGNVTLSGSNTFSGGIAWTSRSLRINNKNALGTGLFGIGGVAAPTTPPLTLTAVSTLAGSDSLTNAVAINQDFTFAAVSSAQFNGPVIMPATRAITINSGVTLTLSGVISNSTAGLNKAGLGTLSLGGANLYTGATAVNVGSLLVNGSLAAGSAVTVASAATLGGSGTINGTVTVNAGGTIAPGTSIGTLTLGAAPTLGGTTLMEISSPSSADKLNVTSGTVIFGGTLTVTNIGGAIANGSTYDLFDGTLSGTFSGGLNLPNGPGKWNISDLNIGGTISYVNASPVAANFSINLGVGGSVTASVIGKYAAALDADSEAVTITAVSTPSSGTAVIVGGTNITYTSTGGPGSDSFTYTVSDGVGGTDTKTVSVTISSPEGFNKLSGPTGAGPYSFSYLGIPGLNYSLDESPNLVAPYTWFPVITNTASGTGAIDYIGVTLSYPSGSFRTRHVP